MPKILLVLVMFLLNACVMKQASNTKNLQSSSSQSSLNLPSSDYAKDLVYPEEVYSLRYSTQHKFENPLWGIQLRYGHIFSKNDMLDVFIYPIPKVSWEETLEVLKQENQFVIDEINKAVEKKHYQSVNIEKTEEVFLANQQGIKTSLELVDSQDAKYQSYSYIFIQKDKFIKLRFSFLKGDGTGLPNADLLAEQLVTSISVPPESPFMKAKREEVIQQQASELIKQLLMQIKEN